MCLFYVDTGQPYPSWASTVPDFGVLLILAVCCFALDFIPLSVSLHMPMALMYRF